MKKMFRKAAVVFPVGAGPAYRHRRMIVIDLRIPAPAPQNHELTTAKLSIFDKAPLGAVITVEFSRSRRSRQRRVSFARAPCKHPMQ